MKKIATIIIAVFTAQLLSGQDSLSIDSCRQQALEYSKVLKKAELQTQEAESYQKAARTAYLPSVSASGNLMQMFDMDDISMPGHFLPTAVPLGDGGEVQYTGESNIYSPGMELELGNLTVLYGGLSVGQPIYAGGKIINSNKKASLGVEMTEYNYQLKRDEVLAKTDQVFWGIAMLEANIELIHKYISMLTELEEQMTNMYDLGLVPASEKLKVVVQKNETELQLIKVNNKLKVSKMYLNQMLGRDLKADVAIQYSFDKLQSVNLNNGVQSALSNRSELQLLNKQIEMANVDKRLTMGDYLPELGLGLQYTGAWVKDLKEDLSFSPMLAAQLTIPLFNWGQGHHKMKAASLKIKQTESELENTRELVSLEVEQSRIAVEEAFDAIKLAEKSLDEATESLEETKNSFDVGLNTTTELLNAQAEWQKAQVQLISAKAEYQIALTNWEKATGTL